MGNVLQGDDGFGVRVLEDLARCAPAPGVRLVDVGIGGIHLVQALMDGWDALVLVDAVDRGGAPGTVWVLEPVVPDWATLPDAERAALLADTHHAVPERVLTLARALGILPAHVYVVGCQPRRTGLGLGLSDAVAPAVEKGSTCVRRLLDELASAGGGDLASGERAADHCP
ncbi:MAG: hydrogenase maturation protease [Gemmatimonadetes bacterium]|nr:hydrogenase maturation protease [Gemmatimonadota bacterium]